ncbi:Hypothetical protein, conserved [Brucella canis ATCC 23365]|uniref:Uncharacterized protein n=2 Tax=Brucella TaxID=234 RepID=A9M7W9_BRUC2|nr:Hypothetical protein, conserved [Brucella canis ATCC 23365]ABY37402.1 Hypothetical protein, conserved [Brucella suis ATCC 23445]
MRAVDAGRRRHAHNRQQEAARRECLESLHQWTNFLLIPCVSWIASPIFADAAMRVPFAQSCCFSGLRSLLPLMARYRQDDRF